GEARTMLPEIENLIVSLLAAPAMAWRNEPAPLSLLLMTDQTAISSRGSSGSMRMDEKRSTRPWRVCGEQVRRVLMTITHGFPRGCGAAANIGGRLSRTSGAFTCRLSWRGGGGRG